jgi:acyl-CoA synthetase (NDP forming)
MNPLKGFLEPESIAIIGVSTNQESLSAIATKNLLKLGFKGKVYLVNPKGGDLFGMKLYTHVSDIMDSLELAIIYLPPDLVIK